MNLRIATSYLCAAFLMGLILAALIGVAEREPPPPPSNSKPIPVENAEEEVYGGARSSKWRLIRDAYVAEHPVCEACGTEENLNVHHIKPFHEFPELELDWDNLITLCREHHFTIGHDEDGPDGEALPNWVESNPNVRRDARLYRESLSIAP